MRRVIAAIIVAAFAMGCSESNGGPSLAEQQRRHTEKELKRIQKEINQNIQNNINAGQNAFKAARPRTGR